MHVCLLCHFRGKNHTPADFSTIESTKREFMVASIGIFLYDINRNIKFILCDGHTNVLSQYFPCRKNRLDNKPRLSSNLINAILNIISGNRFCTYVDRSATMHILTANETKRQFIAKIILLEWGVELYRLTNHFYNLKDSDILRQKIRNNN